MGSRVRAGGGALRGFRVRADTLRKSNSCSCAIVKSTWHGFAYSLLQEKELPCSSKCASPACLQCPRVFVTTRAFARPVFGNGLLARTCLHYWKCLSKGSALRDDAGLRPTCLGKCLRPPMCLRNDAGLRPTSLGDVFSHASCLRDGACLRPTCLRQLSSRANMASLLEVPWQGQCAWEVSSDAHVFSLREVSSPRMCLQTCLRLACVC